MIFPIFMPKMMVYIQFKASAAAVFLFFTVTVRVRDKGFGFGLETITLVDFVPVVDSYHTIICNAIVALSLFSAY